MDTTAPYRSLRQGEMLNWYRIERILGRGGFGVIYLATDTNLDHLVAIKEYRVLVSSGDEDTDAVTEAFHDRANQGLRRFIAEARNLVRFKHPNIVRVMSVFELNDTAYMVMEFEEGHDLREHLKDPQNASETALKSLFVPISRGLAEVHKHGFIHRDIKPANILVRTDGTPVLLDFGSARSAGPIAANTLTALVSAGYSPLEQYSGGSERQQGPWTDIYALGAVLYYAISGTEPVDSAKRGTALLNGGKDPMLSARMLGKERYSRAFLDAIDWALQFRIADRPQSLSQWMPALLQGRERDVVTRRVGEDVVDPLLGLSMRDHPMPREVQAALVRRTADWKNAARRSRTLLIGGLAALLAAVGGGAWLVLGWTDRSGGSIQPSVEASPGQPPVTEDSARRAAAQQAALGLAGQANGSASDAVRVQAELAAETAAASRTTDTGQAAAEAGALAAAESEKALAAAEAEKALAAAEAEKAQTAADAERAQADAESERAQAAAETEVLDAAAEAREQQRLAVLEAARLARLRDKQLQLNAALEQAAVELDQGLLDAAEASLDQAAALDRHDDRLKALRTRWRSALIDSRTPVSDEDFDRVIAQFDQLRRALESNDVATMESLTEPSDQNSLFKQLLSRFARLEIGIDRIRVKNADKSISATLRIEHMVRDNGDRATPSSAYRDRTITSRRIEGQWSLIQW